METRSFKALSILRLQGNLQGNSKETFQFQRNTGKETTIGNDNISVLSEVTDWRPEAKAWLTDTGELRTQGVFDDLAGEIIRLTIGDLPLQAKLLKLHCGRYFGPWWNDLVEQWEERAAIMEIDGKMPRDQAELEAAKLYRMEAFLDELRG